MRPTALQRSDIQPPVVFVSSTFEDANRFIRGQLRQHLEDVGYHPLMSELGEFSYGHGKHPVFDDTISSVALSQLYILIIGRRYGSRHPVHNTSITELEFNAAVTRNIPMLCFIEADVWSGYKAYRAGAANAKKIKHWVDEEEVFLFIDRVSRVYSNPIHSFRDGNELLGMFDAQVANLVTAHPLLSDGSREVFWLG